MELWKQLDEFPKYEISTMGRVRRIDSGRILKPFPDKDGYLRLSLGNVDNVYVHRLMAKTFLEPGRPDQVQVNHKDSNRQNNCIENLEWVTPRENIIHAVNKGRINWQKGLNAAARVNGKSVIIVETSQVFDKITDCAKYLNVVPQAVQRVLKGERATLHGYHIEYV